MSSALVDVIVHGLTSVPKSLPPLVLYDERGSRLFEQITELPEYYPTQAERSLLQSSAAAIAAATEMRTLVELGAGVLDKSQILLDAGVAQGNLQSYVPVDISAEVLGESAEALRTKYASLVITALEADFMGELTLGELHGPTVVCFLGGTIGNLFPQERVSFLRRMTRAAGPDGYLLVGTDLVKDLDRIVSAYFDSAQVTEAFLLNVVDVINTECGTELLRSDFDYVPLWDAREKRMDLRLRARADLEVCLPGVPHACRIARDEEIRIEVSAKFTLDQVATELRAAGAHAVEHYENGDFALTLAAVDR